MLIPIPAADGIAAENHAGCETDLRAATGFLCLLAAATTPDSLLVVVLSGAEVVSVEASAADPVTQKVLGASLAVSVGTEVADGDWLPAVRTVPVTFAAAFRRTLLREALQKGIAETRTTARVVWCAAGGTASVAAVAGAAVPVGAEAAASVWLPAVETDPAAGV